MDDEFSGNPQGFRTAASSLVAAWGRANLDPGAIAPLAELMQRNEQIASEYQALQNGSGTAGITNQVVDGTISLAEAVKLYALASMGNEPVSRGNSTKRLFFVHDECRRLIVGTATRWLGKNGASLADRIGAAFESTKEEIARLSPIVEGLSSDRDAIKAGGQAAKAWMRLTELNERRGALVTVGRMIQRFGFVDEVEAAIA